VYTDIGLYIQTQEPSDFSELTQVQMLTQEFCVEEEHFKKINDNSLVVLDDFSFKPTQSKNYSKSCFLQIVNRYLRHHNIRLCLLIHNLYNNNLFTDILLAPHIFISYSNLGFDIIRY
jgi:DNA replication protein DnaC